MGIFNISPILAAMFGASFAQIGVVLAIILRTKDVDLKGIAIPAFLSGIFGIHQYIFGGLGIFQLACFIDPATNDLTGMYNGMIWRSRFIKTKRPRLRLNLRLRPLKLPPTPN